MADIAKTVAHLPGVRAAVLRVAEERAGQAEARLAAHRKTGAHRIGVSRGRVNALVYMEGPEPGAVEFGHFARDGVTWVDGINALTGAS